MAPNRFATVLHRNTNKISLILVYALLEWMLIAFLLLNSLFSYLILKFAEYFGLKPPCLLCTRLDHVFDPAKRRNNFRIDLLCEAHSKEISRLGFCENHKKLVESEKMCGDCSCSRTELARKDAFLREVKDFDSIQRDGEKLDENGEVYLRCSCCGNCLDNRSSANDVYSSHVLLKTSSWDVLECDPKRNLVICDDYVKETCDLDKKMSGFAANLRADEDILKDKSENLVLSELDRSFELNELIKEVKREDDENMDAVLVTEEEKVTSMEQKLDESMKDKSVQVCFEEDSPAGDSSQHLEFFLDYSGHKLVPIELFDSTEELCGEECGVIENYYRFNAQEPNLDQVEGKDEFVMANVMRLAEVDEVLDVYINDEHEFPRPDDNEKDCENITSVNVSAATSSEFISDLQIADGKEGERHSNVSEDANAMMNNENEADVSIGTEIPDIDITNEMQNLESVHSVECPANEPSPSSAFLYEAEHDGSMQVEEQMQELKPLSVQERDCVINQPSFYCELYEIEEDKVPDTPTSVESLNHLHKKLLLLEKKDSGAEESLDGSVTSEWEGGDGVATIERLKSALRAERKTLQALYAELEEERSASAVAASQTMAMINRLQEEKAAMQMEALQYQRMMDEQSEYDQEALELLNDLMVKREKEKLELEKELEACRKKLLDYEAKEKMIVLKWSKDGSVPNVCSSGSCSNSEESDGLSIDLNQEVKGEGFNCHQEFTPIDTVANLEESLADFEEERLSILEQLKVLEEKLMTIDDDGNDKEHRVENVREMVDFQQENGIASFNCEENGHTNGFLMNSKHHQQRIIALHTGKSLLPLFDAMSDVNTEEVPNGDANEIYSNGVLDTPDSKFSNENKNISIEDEVGHLYQRLQAFEADREFLKHCISSLHKGDKGMDLLREILQHLRDLRNVELRARNT